MSVLSISMNTKDSFRTASKSFLALNAGLFNDQPDRSIAAQRAPETFERERDLHEAILKECRARGFITIHSRMDRPSTTAIGSPDFVVVTPLAVLFIEAKSRTGKLTKEQQNMRAWFEKLGQTCHIIRTMEEFRALL